MKSTYKLLHESLCVEGPLSCSKEVVFGLIWKSPAPSKVVVLFFLFWKLLHNRIPKKDNFARRNCFLLEVNLNFVLCGGEVETPNHLFLHCQVVFQLWGLGSGCRVFTVLL